MAPAGDLRRVFDLLWLDPDPDTAAWVLMLERQRHPETVARRLQDPRPGLASSPFLQGQLRGDATVDEALLAALTGWSMFDDVLPAGLLWLAQRGTVRQFPAGEPVMEKGSISDHLALVLEGDVQVLVDGDATVVLGPGRAIGEIGVLTGQPRTASVRASADGCRLLMLPSATFDDLLRRSDSFSRSLLSQLALRLVDATRKVVA
jgi:CRP-like cAMP-binding protein